MAASGAAAATPPTVDAFSASPAAPRPGERVTLRVVAHDADCGAPPCIAGCGAIVRSDLVSWTDDTGRLPGGFGTPVNDASASPWNGSITWLAPEKEGTYTIRLSLSDNGGMLCGGRQTRVTSLQISVSSVQPPVIESFSVTPGAVPAGGTATLAVAAHDAAGRALTYSFSADAGSMTQASPTSSTATWTAPRSAGAVTVRCTVFADGGAPVTAQATAVVQLGAYVRTLSTPGLRATRVAAMPDGRIALVDGANGLLSVITSGGKVSWTRTGLATPVAVAVNGGELYVIERAARRISVWTASGGRVRDMPLHAAVAGQLVAGPGADELCFTDISAARIIVVSAHDGAVLRTVGDGLLKAPSGLAVKGRQVGVADAAAGRVYIFDASGALATIVGSETSFVRPQGLTWDGAGSRLVAADSYSGELTIFAEDGTFLGTLGGFGSGEGNLLNPVDVTLLPGGLLAVPTGAGEIPLFQVLATLLPVAPPTRVTAMDRLNDDGGAVAVSWVVSTDDPGRVTAYRVERAREESEIFEVLGSTVPGTTSFTDESLLDDACHRYRIVATDGSADAQSEPSPCVSARNDLAPPPPGFVVAGADSATTATIEWGGSPAADLGSYAIEVGGLREPWSTTAPPGVTSLPLAELSPETAYSVSVRAVDVAGNSSVASGTTFRTPSNEPPSAPLSVSAVDAKSGGRIDVTWAAASSAVVAERYRVTCTPMVEGWTAFAVETSETRAQCSELVNQLSYSVAVVAIGAFGLESEPSVAVVATPTIAARSLPVVAATSPTADASGLAIEFPFDKERRTVRLEYRATSTTVQPFIDGSAVSPPLAETMGAWKEAELELDHRFIAEGMHTLELRSTSFPDAGATLELRRIDFVPLAPAKPGTESFNTVVDIFWEWPDARRDLGVRLTRDGVPVPCRAAAIGRCREGSLENQKKQTWILAAVSPAGWVGPSREVTGMPKYEEWPPPVTDLTFEPLQGAWRVAWSPVSTAVTRSSPAAPAALYRVYAAGTLLGEVSEPWALLPQGLDPSSVVVRSVDAAGRESQ